MSCGYSREILALYIEDDLPAADAVGRVESHVSACVECRRYCEQLRESQSFIKSRFQSQRHVPVSQEMLTSVRHAVMSQIDTTQQSLGWAVRLERFLMVGLRGQRYAIVGFAIVAIVSMSLLGQMRYAAPKTDRAAAAFVGNDRLLSPSGYREWVFAGSSAGVGCPQKQTSQTYHNVYIDPASYREYAHSGKFPDGTVIVRETFSAPEKVDLNSLAVSVKDTSRFDDGWGFYDFTEGSGKQKPETEALPQTAGCIACHRDKAATDHVFTQFYPVLRGIGS